MNTDNGHHFIGWRNGRVLSLHVVLAIALMFLASDILRGASEVADRDTDARVADGLRIQGTRLTAVVPLDDSQDEAAALLARIEALEAHDVESVAQLLREKSAGRVSVEEIQIYSNGSESFWSSNLAGSKVIVFQGADERKIRAQNQSAGWQINLNDDTSPSVHAFLASFGIIPFDSDSKFPREVIKIEGSETRIDYKVSANRTTKIWYDSRKWPRRLESWVDGEADIRMWYLGYDRHAWGRVPSVLVEERRRPDGRSRVDITLTKAVVLGEAAEAVLPTLELPYTIVALNVDGHNRNVVTSVKGTGAMRIDAALDEAYTAIEKKSSTLVSSSAGTVALPPAEPGDRSMTWTLAALVVVIVTVIGSAVMARRLHAE